MIVEEIHLRLGSLLEKEGRKPRKPSVQSADDEPTEPTPTAGNNPQTDKRAKDAKPVGHPTDLDGMDDLGGPQEPVDPELEDDGTEDEVDAIDAKGDAADDPSGAVNDEISGKTVQAITIEPKSKVLPGAKEVILTFNETTDSLRVLVTGTGQVKFFYRGQLHDLP